MPFPVLPDSLGQARAFFLLPLTSDAPTPEGGEHLCLLRLASLPRWVWRDPSTALGFDPVNATADEIVTRSLELIWVDELGALAE
jgi:hypothetical protein